MIGEPRIPRSNNPLLETATDSDVQQLGKAALRSLLKARRRSVDIATRRAWDEHIGARVIAWCQRHRVTELAVFSSLPGEPELGQAYAQLARAGVRLALPVVLARDAALGFADWEPGEAMDVDQFGVAVPRLLRMRERPPALLVPCLGFNERGFRLGYGGGFYDRTLAAQPRPATVGIAYACQCVAFAADAHDIALDQIITEASAN